MNAAANSKVTRELECIMKLSKGSKDEAKILAACLTQGVPYVDVNFPPQQESLSRPGIDARTVAPAAWKRPTDFVPADLAHTIAVFCGGIEPDDIDQGQLDDCWLLCAIAALAEFPDKVTDIFAHPERVTRDDGGGTAYRSVPADHQQVRLVAHGPPRRLLPNDWLQAVLCPHEGVPR